MSTELDKTAKSYVHVQALVSWDLTHEILYSEEGTIPITLLCVAQYYIKICHLFNF